MWKIFPWTVRTLLTFLNRILMRKSWTIAFSPGYFILYVRTEIVIVFFFFLSQQWGSSVILQDRLSSKAQSFSPWEPAISHSSIAFFYSFLKVIHFDKRLQTCDFTEEPSEIISLFLQEELLEVLPQKLQKVQTL